MRESKVERALVDAVEAAGGVCWKWVSPNMRGVPDRVAVLPGGRVVFVELKAPGKRPTPQQQRRHAELRARGADVRTVDSTDDIAGVLACC